MTFIDWSDSDEMLGLLSEYVADEWSASAGDVERAAFLSELAREIHAIIDRPPEQTIQSLRSICDSQSADFAGDEVLTHVRDCIEELERIQSQTFS